MTYKIIPTKVHGAIDYLVGTALTSSPIFLKDSPEGAILLSQGVTATAYSLLTDYELGASRKLSVKTHLVLDVLSGAFLVASPWIFKLEKRSKVALVALGLFEITTALLTKTEPED